MPALTPPDLSVLPRLPLLSPSTIQRPVLSVTTAPLGLEGEGFPVHRAFAGVDQRLLDPFVHMDQMGAVEYAPGEPKGTPWHPHRGFETVTYMLDGTFVHQDSNGGGGVITNGDTQWMTAGSGILHIETPPSELVASGGLFHGIQLWVNLPASQKWTDPHYQDIRSQNIGLLTSQDGSSLIRVIAGSVGSISGPGVTHTPMTMAHLTLEPGEQVILPWSTTFNALVYALSGKGSVGPTSHPIQSGQLAVFSAGDALTIRASKNQDNSSPTLDVLVLGGQPLHESVAWYGPFVMNTQDELRQAFADYQSGRMGTIPTN